MGKGDFRFRHRSLPLRAKRCEPPPRIADEMAECFGPIDFTKKSGQGRCRGHEIGAATQARRTVYCWRECTREVLGGML